MPCFFYFELFLKREKRKGRGFLRERVLSSTSSTSRPPFLALLPRRANARSPPPRPSPPPFEQLDAGAQGLEDTALAAGRRGSKKEKQRTKKKKKAEGQGGGGGGSSGLSFSARSMLDQCSLFFSIAALSASVSTGKSPSFRTTHRYICEDHQGAKRGLEEKSTRAATWRRKINAVERSASERR